MLCIAAKEKRPVQITDTKSGTTWELFYYLGKTGEVVLCFEAPQSVKINYLKIANRKEIPHETSNG